MPGAKILDFSQEEWLLFTSTMVVHRKIFTAQCGWFEKFHEEVMDGILKKKHQSNVPYITAQIIYPP